ncbi:MAG: hypothetical protein WBQ94_30955 [Terracidiphilus sp.]
MEVLSRSADRSWSLSRRTNTVAGRFRVILAFLVLHLIVLTQTGCSGTKSALGSISVTNPTGGSGQANSVIVNNSVDVTVSVIGNAAGLGVDWNLLCGGSAVVGYTTDVCGSLTPVHVGSNIAMVYLAPQYVPVGNTVTLTATVTGNPSQSASVTLTILAQPATIQFTQGFLPPSAIAGGGTAKIAATVTNDPTFAGVTWSATCGSSPCGSFKPTTTASGGVQGVTVYTAPSAIPAGQAVTVTATSIYSSSASVSSTIQTTPISVGVTVTPNPVQMVIPASLTATFSWDVASDSANWSRPSCAAVDCGAVTPGSCSAGGTASAPTNICTATYNAPASLPAGTTTFQISETVASAADPTKSATINFLIAPPPPVSVSLAVSPSAVQVNGTTTLAATVTYDYLDEGVTWQCSPACPFLTSSTSPSSITSNSATYTAPYTPTAISSGVTSMPVVMTATSIADPTASASSTLTVYPPISVTPTTQPVTAGVPATFSAIVNNEIAPGGVDWAATGCPGLTIGASCGTFGSGGHSASGTNITYTLQTNIHWGSKNPMLTITATSTASETIPPIQSTSVQVPVTPVSFVQFVPFAPSTLPVGNPSASSPTLISLVASAINDATNQGVDWTVSCTDASAAACGQFLETPEMVAATVKQTQDVPAAFWSYGLKVHAANGQAVAYEPPTQIPTGGTVTLTATSTGTPTASGSQVVNITNNLTGPALSGKVQVGSLPVSGAKVQLFSAGNTGYGSAATPLVISNGGSSVTTANDGSFSIPAGFTCPSLNTLVYLVALGGQPGGPQAAANPQLGLISAIGPCSNLNGTVPLIVNEVTTVASVFALTPFIGSDYAHIGSSSTNYNNGPNASNAANNNNGLANAFATVNNLVDITTGVSLLTTPAGTGTAPQAEINTLADVINTCAASAGGAPGDGSACDAFFEAANVNPPNGAQPTAANAPTSILQALIEVAQVPSSIWGALIPNPSGTNLYNLVANPSLNLPFTPILTGAPYDWSVAISYTGGGLEGKSLARPLSSSLAIDAAGNLWISNKNISSVTELSNTGAALSPYSTGTTKATGGGFKGGGLTSPKSIAIDPFGDAWVLNGTGTNGSSTVSELAYNGVPLSPSSAFSGGSNPANTGVGMAIDGNGNVWVADSGSPGDVSEYAGYNGGSVNQVPVATGTPLSPSGVGFVGSASTPINNPNGGIAVDGSNNIWLLDQGYYAALELNSASGALLDLDQGDSVDSDTGLPDNPPSYVLNSSNFGTSMAIDHAGDIFIPYNLPTLNGGAQVYELAAGASTANFGGTGQTIDITNVPISVFEGDANPLYPPIAIDGAGDMWAIVQPFGGSTILPLALTEFSPSGSLLNGNGAAQGFVASSMSGSNLSGVAVDASGNVWVLSGNNPTTVTEFIGAAKPVVTPMSVGAQKNKLGSRP